MAKIDFSIYVELLFGAIFHYNGKLRGILKRID